MDNAKEQRDKSRLGLVLLIALSWFALTALAPYYQRAWDLRRIHPVLPAALRMTLMYLVTWLYVRLVEKKTFGEGFSWSFKKIGKSVLWAFLVFLVTTAVVTAYQALVVVPLMKQTVEASGAAAEESVRPFWSRLVEYAYIVYEGLIEVLIFIGFLLDRMARIWKPAWALLASNVLFALWHYNYWRKGLLEGSLMIILTFLAGLLISLGYLKTKNSLTPALSHFLVDAPSGLKELFGITIPFIS